MDKIIDTAVSIPPKKAKKLLPEICDWAESFFSAFLAVIVVLTFVVRGTVVEGDSMLPTLMNGEFLVLSRAYLSPRHNDIVVVFAPDVVSDDGRNYGKTLIKRVVGLPGDVIMLDTEIGAVYRNGEPLSLEVGENFIRENGHAINEFTLRAHDMESGVPVTVPQNHIFVLGDNRNNSIDSRSDSVGMVDMNYVIGVVMFRMMPLNRFGLVD